MRPLTSLAIVLTLACGRIDLGSYGMDGMSNTSNPGGGAAPVSQRPPDVIIIGPVTSETTFEPANPVTERPGEEPHDEQQRGDAGTEEQSPSGGVDAGADGGAADAGTG